MLRDERWPCRRGQGWIWWRCHLTRTRRFAGLWTFGKYQFEQNKKANASKKKQKQIQIKEVKFRPGTEEGDYQVKLRNLTRFLTQGDKAKVTLRFRGREMAHQELGVKLLKRVQADLDETRQRSSSFRRLEGRQLVMVMTPRKK